jgi:hypothetical protein
MGELQYLDVIGANAARIRQGLRKKRQEAAHQKRAAAMRNLANLEKMIADVERGILALQLSINVEIASARVHDPSQCGYPITARTLASRRDNLKLTLAVLSDRLAELRADSGQVGGDVHSRPVPESCFQ